MGMRRAMSAPMPPPMASRSDDQDPGQHRNSGRRSAERRRNGDRHAEHAEHVAVARGHRARQPAQREDEQHAGGEIEQRYEIRRHGVAGVRPLTSALELIDCRARRRSTPPRPLHFFGSRFLYMPSMRWVTRKPPKMFTEAMTSARKPKTLASDAAGGDQAPPPTASRRRRRSPRRWRWSRTSAGCAAPA